MATPTSHWPRTSIWTVLEARLGATGHKLPPFARQERRRGMKSRPRTVGPRACILLHRLPALAATNVLTAVLLLGTACGAGIGRAAPLAASEVTAAASPSPRRTRPRAPPCPARRRIRPALLPRPT